MLAINYLFVLVALLLTIALSSSSSSVSNNEHQSWLTKVADDKSFSAGHLITCAVEQRSGVAVGGPIKCWGQSANKDQLRPPAGIHTQVSCGRNHCCAIKLDETVHCWGRMPDPSDGVGADNQSNGNAPRFRQISSGEYHMCGLRTNGSIQCWGRNHFGESEAPSERFVQVSCGNGYTCGLLHGGSVSCWGRNNKGQLTPPSGKRYKEINAGFASHVCGIDLEGKPVCWGSNEHSQATVDHLDLEDDEHVMYHSIATGHGITCAIREHDRSLKCWGRRPPIPESEWKSKQFQSITMGQGHMCVVDKENEIECWVAGKDDNGNHLPPLGMLVRP